MASLLVGASERAEPGAWTLVVRLTSPAVEGGLAAVAYAEGPEGRISVGEGVAPGDLALEISTEADLQLELEVDGHWCPRVEVRRGNLPKKVEVTCYPEGTLSGRVEVTRGLLVPEELVATAQPSADRSVKAPPFPKEARVACPVAKDRSWKCRVPAGRFDLRLKAYGFAGHYFWDLRLGQGEELELGTVAAVAGSSLVGRVETPDGSPLEADVELWLESPAQVPGRKPQAGSFRERLAVERPGRDGFFQFEGLAPGLVLLSARGVGRVGADRVRVELYEGLESTLRQPIVLSPAVALEVYVEPRHDPEHKPWKVHLSRREANRPTTRLEGAVDADGYWRQEGLGVGLYRLGLESDRGDRWHMEDVEVEAGRPPVFVTLPIVHVHGFLKREEEPVSAHLWFGGVSGFPRVHTWANDKGAFHGLLPRAGRWKVTLQKPEPERTYLELEDVDIEEPEAGAVVELTIQVPAGEVRGVVVDSKGAPVEGARVEGMRLAEGGGDFTGGTDAEGRFTAEMLSEGEYRFMARRDRDTSAQVALKLSKAIVPPEIRLVLASERIQGRVMSGNGPVVGAAVESLPVDSLGNFMASSNLALQTDTAGAFEIAVPPDAAEVSVVVFPQGYAARAMRIPPTREQEAVIAVDREGGKLQLEFPDWGRREELIQPFLSWNGSLVFVSFLLQRWAVPHGTAQGWPKSLTLPMMEPGEYELCVQVQGEGEKLSRQCAAGFLAPNGELELSLAEM